MNSSAGGKSVSGRFAVLSRCGGRVLAEEYPGQPARERHPLHWRSRKLSWRRLRSTAPTRLQKRGSTQAQQCSASESAPFQQDSTTSHGGGCFRDSPDYDRADSTNPLQPCRCQDSSRHQPLTCGSPPQPTSASRIRVDRPRHPATTKGQMPSPIAS